MFEKGAIGRIDDRELGESLTSKQHHYSDESVAYKLGEKLARVGSVNKIDALTTLPGPPALNAAPDPMKRPAPIAPPGRERYC